MVQPLTKVRVRHHQVDQPAVLGTRYTRNAQGAGLSGADGALGSVCVLTSTMWIPLKQHWFLGALACGHRTLNVRWLHWVTSNCPRMLTCGTTSAPDGFYTVWTALRKFAR
jgi:hypothetical protein